MTSKLSGCKFYSTLSIFLLLKVFCIEALIGQSSERLINVNYYGVGQGLAHHNVQSIVQDRQGFIWIGSKYGLNRFDGYTFKLFTREQNGLQSNSINHILVDGEGKLWLINTTNRIFQTALSIDIFDPVTEEVKSFESKFGNKAPFAVKDIRSFAASEDGQIAFITVNNKLIRYIPGQSFKQNDIGDKSFFISCFSRHNTIYGHSSQGDTLVRNVVVEIDFNGNILHKQVEQNQNHYNFIGGVDRSDRLWYISKFHSPGDSLSFVNGILYSVDANGIKKELLSNHSAHHTTNLQLAIPTYSNEYNFWIQPDINSFYLYGRNSFQVFLPDESFHVELSKQYPWLAYPNTVYFDRQGKTWVATENGIYEISVQKKPFGRLLYETKDTRSAIRGITKDNSGNMWVACDRGPTGLWIREHNKKDFMSFKEYWEINGINKKLLTLDLGYIYSLFTDSKGYVWFGSGKQSSVFQIDPVAKTYKEFPYHIDQLIKGQVVSIWSFYEDADGKIWFGTDAGRIGFIDRQDSLVILNEMKGLNAVGGTIYQFVNSSEKNQLQLCSDNGFYNLNTNTHEISEFNPFSSDKQVTKSYGSILFLHFESDGSKWIGTKGNGLIHWLSDNTTRQYTFADGLSDNTIYAIYSDDYDNLWLPSDYGIIRFNKKTSKSIAYTESDGICQNEFNRIAHYRDISGTIYFGGLNGITYFKPQDFYQDSSNYEAELAISSFQQFDSKQNILVDKRKELLESNSIEMNPDDLFFTLGFSLLSYDDVHRIRYAYKIEGVDADWIYQTENNIRLSRLPFGDYKLKIKAQASTGQWSKRELTLDLKVNKPFYLRGWFILIIIAMILFCIILFSHWRTSQLKSQNQFLENEVNLRTKTIQMQRDQLAKQANELIQLDQMKSRFFANVSHELRTPLSLIVGPVEQLIKSDEPNPRRLNLLQKIKQGSGDLLKLINSILQLSKLDERKIVVQMTSTKLVSFISRIVSAFHSNAEYLGIKLTFGTMIDKDIIVETDQEKLKSILENFIMNAIKFTAKGGEVNVHLSETDAAFIIAVEDTGRGIDEHDLPKVFDRFYQAKKPLRGNDQAPVEGGIGLGLAICKEYAELLHAKVWVESKLNQGSTFFLQFPKQLSETINPLKGQESNVDELKSMDNEEFIEDIHSTNESEKTSGILLVEDNRELRDYLAYILSTYYHVYPASNGEEAISILHNKFNDCQLILSDIIMPVMDGFQLLEKIKMDKLYQSIPVIMLTARADIQDKLRALRIGVDDYIIKPFHDEELLVRISNLIENSRARKLFIKQSFDESHEEFDNSKEQENNWLEQLENVVRREVSNELLSVSLIAKNMFISERQLQRRIKSLTGLGPNHYIREIRLQHSRRLLENHFARSVKEAAASVNFKDEKYFAQIFYERFGKNPSEYL